MPAHDDGPVPVRRYDDAEVRTLLERAARLQGTTPAAARTTGLTLGELEEIAAESHIDVSRLRQAAHELDMEQSMRPAGFGARLAGAPIRIHVERTLPFEVDEKALGRLVATLGAATDESGESNLVGRTFTWQAKATSGRRMDAQVTVHRGTTHVRIEERYGELASGLFAGVIGGVGGGGGLGAGTAVATALGSIGLAIAIPAALIGGSYAACRVGYGAYVRHRGRRLGEICDRIAQELEALRDAPD